MLDVFFRKYAWIANAALVAAAAWLSARTVNTVVAASIRPRPQVDLAAFPISAAAPSPAPLDANRLYPLLGLTPPPPPEAPSASAAPPPQPQNCYSARTVPARTGLRLLLVGAVLADRPESSLATILDVSSRDTRSYGVGDQILGATLLGVERMSDPNDATGTGFRIVAVLCHSGQKEYVDFDASSSPAPPPLSGALAPALGAPGEPGLDASAVRKVSDTRYEIPKRVVDQSLSNLNQLATQARIVPSFKNGVANGFKLFSIQPGSLYSAIGVENGDVIQRINGYEINSPDKALEVYQKLREAHLITLELERNGLVIRKDYNITGP